MLILVDGSSYLYRAFHALPPLTNSRGEPTGAVYGVINMIKKLAADYPSDDMAVIFDAPGKTFRNELYSEYKAHRPPMPDDLQRQIAPLHRLIQAMGIPLFCFPGIEADDVIGTLTQQALDKGLSVLISTGDKDMAQLVNPRVTLINTMTNTVMDEAGVEQKFGVTPTQIIDYLALIGDSSDNIPGIPSVGPKTAAKWLQTFGSVDNLLANAHNITGKVGEKLRENQEQLALARQLVTIQCHLDLPITLDSLHHQKSDTVALLDEYKKLEFKNLIKELETSIPSSITKNYQTILTETDFHRWLKRLTEAELFSMDTETTSLNCIQAELVGLSFCITPGEAIYIPVAHDTLDAPKQLDRNWVLQQLKPLLENPKPQKIGHHLKYDKNVLANYGINLEGIAYDTMMESYVLNSIGNRHNLNALALNYLGIRPIHFEDIAGKGTKQLTFNQIPIEQASKYAAEDADITLQLHQTLWPKLDESLHRVFTDIELPLISILSRMETYGVLVDAKKLHEQSHTLGERIQLLQEEAHHLAGQPFNLSSPKQLQQILYEKLNLPILLRTPKGQPSTAEEALQALAINYDLPKLILEHRTLSKIKSTYTDCLPKQIEAKTGRIHTYYHQAVTTTGRLSSSDPNLQNIPIRTEEGRRIRQAFIASPGYKLIAADYSQIELRIMAHFSQDSGLLDAFEKKLDIHTATAAEVFGVTPENVTSDQRRSAKAINFGLIYGMSSFGLARQLGTSRKEAQTYIDIYFARYPGVLRYMNNTRELARKQGYVETLFGRRLYLPEINTRNPQRQKAAERAAINAPLQGTAADIIKLAMICVDRWIRDSKIPASLIMQVHDELVLEVKESEVETAAAHLEDCMIHAVKLSAPLAVDIGIGNNWDEAH